MAVNLYWVTLASEHLAQKTNNCDYYYYYVYASGNGVIGPFAKSCLSFEHPTMYVHM